MSSDSVQGQPAAGGDAPYQLAWTTASPDPRVRSVLRGHSGVITVICAYTYDGIPYLASASDDGSARVWDPATGECLHTITGPVSRVPRVIRFSQDGTAEPAQFNGRVLGACGFAGIGGPRLAQAPVHRRVRLHARRHPDARQHQQRRDRPDRGRRRSGRDPGPQRHQGRITGVCAFALGGTTLLATSGLLLAGTSAGLLAFRLDPESVPG